MYIRTYVHMYVCITNAKLPCSVNNITTHCKGEYTTPL